MAPGWHRLAWPSALPSAPSLAIDAAMFFAPTSTNAILHAAQGFLGTGMAQ
jgi:hypothetical protein